METIPCKGCICVPKCSNKYYFELYSQCIFIKRYLFTTDRGYMKLKNIELARNIEYILSPTKWRISKRRKKEFIETEPDGSSGW